MTCRATFAVTHCGVLSQPPIRKKVAVNAVGGISKYLFRCSRYAGAAATCPLASLSSGRNLLWLLRLSIRNSLSYSRASATAARPFVLAFQRFVSRQHTYFASLQFSFSQRKRSSAAAAPTFSERLAAASASAFDRVLGSGES